MDALWADPDLKSMDGLYSSRAYALGLRLPVSGGQEQQALTLF